jgi:hypothetical protein
MNLHLLRPRRMLVLLAALTLGPATAAASSSTSISTATLLLRVAFDSPSQGVGLFETSESGNDGRGPQSCVLYVRPTTNGGTSFGSRGATLARTNCVNGLPFSSIRFGGRGELLAYGRALMVSHNMGRTWIASAIHGSVAALATRGPDDWALITRCVVGQRSCRLTLVEADDRGDRWTPVPQQPPRAVVASPVVFSGESGATSLLAVSSDDTPVLALPLTTRTQAVVEQLGAGRGHWSVTDAPCDAGEFGTELSIAPDGSRWLACASEPSTGVQPKSMAVSNNAGKRWRVTAPMCDLGTGCAHQRMPIGGSLDGLFALDSHTAFYVGYRGSLAGTSDGGATWRTWPRIGGGDTGTLQVTFVNAHDGWALADNTHYEAATLWRTQDGGTEWRRA